MTARFFRIALALAVASAASTARAADPAAPSTEDEKIVYAIAYKSAKNLDALALKPEEVEVFVNAMRDSMTGKTAPIDVETYAGKVQIFAEGRATEAAKVEKAASADFLAKEAAAAGATKSATGLIKRVTKQGTGPSPKLTDTVKVHYHGTLRDGEVFDSSVNRGEPAEFPLNRVIPCWTEAVQTMKVGEKAHITCPSDLAYGDHGHPPKIKGGATLAFDVELIEIVNASSESSPQPHP
jgi:FKBP-type peptidyl-prolyl cis-trans isomerase FkpA